MSSPGAGEGSDAVRGRPRLPARVWAVVFGGMAAFFVVVTVAAIFGVAAVHPYNPPGHHDRTEVIRRVISGEGVLDHRALLWARFWFVLPALAFAGWVTAIGFAIRWSVHRARSAGRG